MNKILCFLLFFENQLQQIWKTGLVSSKNQKKTRFLRILHDHCNHNIMDNISVHANPHVFRKHLMQLTDPYAPHAFFEIYAFYASSKRRWLLFLSLCLVQRMLKKKSFFCSYTFQTREYHEKKKQNSRYVCPLVG